MSTLGFPSLTNPVNGELAAKLESEISLEKDMRDPDSFPAHLKEYLDNSPFTLEDTAGKEEVVMTRKFGDEQYVQDHNTRSRDSMLT